jgi:hypothetical protein
MTYNPMQVQHRMIYTLVPADGDRWIAAHGIRITAGLQSRDGAFTKEAFDTKENATAWLLQRAEELRVPFLRKVAPTSVPLPLGGMIPEPEPVQAENN